MFNNPCKFIFMFLLLAPLMMFAADNQAAPSDKGTASDLVPSLRGRNFFAPEDRVSLKGKVLDVMKFRHHHRRGFGIHLKLESDGKQYDVHLGPAWYLDKIGLAIKAGDEIAVEGSQVEFRGQQAIIAISVKEGEKTFHLRNDKGVPEWRGRGWRHN